MSCPTSRRRRFAMLAAAFPAVCAAPLWAAAPVKLMLLGDSITQGANGYVGYRYPLYYDLQAGGYSFDYVGTQTTGQPGTTPIAAYYPNYNNPALFDNQSEGHYGYTSAQIINDGAGFTIAASAAAYVPDVVEIHLGTNDLNTGGVSSSTGYQPTLNNLATIVGSLRAANPNVKVLLSQITPLRSDASSGFGAVSGQVPGYNAALATLASSITTAASPVTLVDQNTNFLTQADLQFDGIHPNQWGEQLMADRYYVALQKVLSPGQPIRSPAIHVANPGFDDTTPQATDATYANPNNQGWTFARTASSDGGILNPGAASYATAAGAGTPIGADGAGVGYLYNGSDATAAGRSSIIQQMGALLTAH